MAGTPCPTLEALIEQGDATLEQGTHGGVFVVLNRRALEAGGMAVAPSEPTRWLSLNKDDLYWSRPAVGSGSFEGVRESQMLLLEAPSSPQLLLPVVDGDLVPTLWSDGEGLALRWEGALPGQLPEKATLLLMLNGIPDEEIPAGFLIALASGQVCARQGGFTHRLEKRFPEFGRGLGWCTWDAFYQAVDAEKVRAGLAGFANADVRLRFMILDDGWLDTRDEYLVSFEAHPTKFPDGLGALIAEAKDVYGLQQFGVWHTLQGYWGGVDPDGPLAKRYRLVETEGVIRPWTGKTQPLCLVHPDDAPRFFLDWHDALRRQGVDFVKVDGQNALRVFGEGKFGRGGLMRAYQLAVQGSVGVHFDGAMIHCMCNASETAANLIGGGFWRNSDDFFPAKPESHGFHIWANVMNALWSQQFSRPDWDMFWSGHPQGGFHAVARALSGGPIYVSDKPGEFDAALLKRLILTPEGETLYAEDIRIDTMGRNHFDDPRSSGKLLRLIASGAEVEPLVGLFNCQAEGAITEPVCLADWVDAEPDAPLLVWRVNAQKLDRLRTRDSLEVTLGPLEAEVVWVLPREGGRVQALGWIDKFAGLDPSEVSMDGLTAQWVPTGFGRAGFWCRSKPKQVIALWFDEGFEDAEEEVVEFEYDANQQLLSFEVPAVGSEEANLAYAILLDR